MKFFKSIFIASFLSLFLGMSVSAVNFESEIQAGLLKKYAILTEHFKIEFSNLIYSQPDSDGDGIPDVVENVAEYAERSWDVEIDNLDYDSPIISDIKVLIVLDDRNTYLYPGSVGVTTVLSDAITPLIAIDPWQNEDVMKVTLAHEFFHAVQFGYDSNFAITNTAVNFAESTAVWMEDVVYDSVNDFYNYLQDFFDYPDYSVFAGNTPQGSLFPYGLSAWPTFLAEYYNDTGIIKDIFDEFFSSNLSDLNQNKVYDAVSEVVNSRGDQLSDVYMEFSLWNLDTSNYSEGSHFPDVYTMEGGTLGQYNLIDSDYAPALYGTNYLFFENDANQDRFYFHVVKPDEVSAFVTLISDDNGKVDLNKKVSVEVDKNEEMSEISISGLTGKDGVYALVSVFDDSINPSTAGSDVFDYGYVYYYAADFGESVQNGASLPDATVSEKEGEEITVDEIRTSDSLVLSVTSFDEESVTLRWNRLTDSRIKGYEIHYSTENGASQVEEVPNAYTTSRTIHNLTENETYYFQVVAVDSNGNEVGDPSGELVVIPMEWIFTDVSYLDQHYEAIDSLVELGIFEGYPDGSFKPNNDINRAELLKILIEGRDTTPSVNDYNNCFPDVGREWFAPYVCFAKVHGMIKGYPDGTFRPGETVNKVEALKMLFAVMGNGYENLVEGVTVSSLVYPDLDKTAWYAIYVWRASALGILEETPGEEFNPDAGRTRAEMSEELYRYLQALAYEVLSYKL
ncbi:S-layer homology domain-containing protein [Patescibacteria group bacterium]|nr:S-layer homology domain-containing protein [Patescibacteria group bacterium]